jgi:hypothetical protein
MDANPVEWSWNDSLLHDQEVRRAKYILSWSVCSPDEIGVRMICALLLNTHSGESEAKKRTDVRCVAGLMGVAPRAPDRGEDEQRVPLESELFA